MSWSDREVQILKEKWPTHSANEIARLLDNKTRNAVVGKAHRLGLEQKTRPIKLTTFSPTPLVTSTVMRVRITDSDAALLTEYVQQGFSTAQIIDFFGDRYPARTIKSRLTLVRKKASPVTKVQGAASAIPSNNQETNTSAAETFVPQPLPTTPSTDRVESVVETTAPVSRVERCQWPFGEPGSSGFRFCGEPCVKRKSYCDTHYAQMQPVPRPSFSRPHTPPQRRW